VKFNITVYWYDDNARTWRNATDLVWHTDGIPCVTFVTEGGRRTTVAAPMILTEEME
jgi:hypothetical protein